MANRTGKISVAILKLDFSGFTETRSRDYCLSPFSRSKSCSIGNIICVPLTRFNSLQEEEFGKNVRRFMNSALINQCDKSSSHNGKSSKVIVPGLPFLLFLNWNYSLRESADQYQLSVSGLSWLLFSLSSSSSLSILSRSMLCGLLMSPVIPRV